MCNPFKSMAGTSYSNRPNIYHFTFGNFNVHWVTFVFAVLLEIILAVLVFLDVYGLIYEGAKKNPNYIWEHPIVRLIAFGVAFVTILSLIIGHQLKKPFLYQPCIILLRILNIVFMGLLIIEFSNVVVSLNNIAEPIDIKSKSVSVKQAQVLAIKAMLKIINLFAYFGVSILVMIVLNIFSKDYMFIRKLNKAQQAYHTVPQSVNRQYPTPSNEYEEHVRLPHTEYESAALHYEKNSRGPQTVVV